MKQLSPERIALLETAGHLLVLGGPGSGKTTIAIHKADHEIGSDGLKSGQRVLFLSFARATVSKVAEQARRQIVADKRKLLEISTYHGFAWNVLRSHGYLLRPAGRIRLLPPPEASSRMVELTKAEKETEKLRLFHEEGLLHFDLFARMTATLLSRSQSLAQIISDAYPIIILDEFQDTNADEWAMIQAFGQRCCLIALADPEQRIYEFRGADPRRIGEFATAFSPTTFDFGAENHRSNGTDIVIFGNDLLSGGVTGKEYNNVKVARYGYYQDRSALFPAKVSIINCIKRLRSKDVENWSVAVLVPSKRMMLQVSDYLSEALDNLPAIFHDVAFDAEGPALAASAIAGLLESDPDHALVSRRLLQDLVRHMRGRSGPDGPSKAILALSGVLSSHLEGATIRGKNRLKIIEESNSIAVRRADLVLSGEAGEDWLAVRALLSTCESEVLRQIADDAKYLRLLRKGTMLRARLGDLWRSTGGYVGAAAAVQGALLQEHFSTGTHEIRGIYVMTIHKAKGKEFDEVVIFEGRHNGRIVRSNATEAEIAQARLSLRVGVTRARRNTIILTPASDPCPFL